MSSFDLVPKHAVDTIRMLSVDAVQAANSGHPGTPMGAAELTLTLWTNHLRFNPEEPEWQDRDRFVLSVGHASMLLYSMLHLYGFDCTLDDLKNFRKYKSRTAGHPEYGYLPGIETTTGPLGQGVANAVGLALGQSLMAGKFPGSGRAHTWCLAGDGCMMEGIAYEAASLAGHLGLNNLTLVYDRNKITIDGSTDLAFTEDVGARFAAMGWRVLEAGAYDQAALNKAYAEARASQDKPTLVIVSSVIGYGAATLEGTSATHGAALGEKEVAATKAKIGWPAEPFYISDETKAWFKKQIEAKKTAYAEDQKAFQSWRSANAEAAKAYDALLQKQLPANIDELLGAGMATEKASSRKHSGKVINALAKAAPWLIGGSADLAESNCSPIKDGGNVKKDGGLMKGRNINFGVREHAMAAICNGLALHGAWLPYCATFLQFADYMRPSIRLAALMKLKVVFNLTHDSVLLGEDGPTHAPVEHLAALRLIPGLTVWRPADGLETAMAWAWAAKEAKGPVALALSRQNLALSSYPAGFESSQIFKGAYVLEENASADFTFIATGSELGTAVEAARLLAAQGLKARVVSMPSSCVFGRQDAAYQSAVLGSKPRVVVEAGSTGIWASVVGSDALVIGVDRFGISAPGDDVARHFGLTPQQIADQVKAWMSERVKATA